MSPIPQDNFQTIRSVRRELRKLLQDAQKVLGVSLCFHDHFHLSQLEILYRNHTAECCTHIKRLHEPQCTAFCSQETHDDLNRTGISRVHICPFGITEVASPVHIKGVFAGVLFATLGKVKPDSRAEAVRSLNDALATQIGKLIQPFNRNSPLSRQQKILAFFAKSIERRSRLEELANHLSLSPSRTGRLIKELFGRTFPEMAQEFKLRHAARLLSTTDWTVTQIAFRVGFEDPNYFSRRFKQFWKLTPRSYRKQYRTEA